MTEARRSGSDWELGDGEARHQAAPRRFFIPPREVRASLRRGDVVKLLFEYRGQVPGAPGAERMWVRVDGVTAGGYVGLLTNRPAAIRDLALGDPILFGPEHVIGVVDEEWDRYANQSAFVNVRLLDNDDLEPRLVVHEPSDLDLPAHSDGTRASGWQLLVGDETEEELDSASSIRTPNLGWLMERYPLFGALVRSGATAGGWVLSSDGTRYEPEASS